jgi:prevent-host-death family protein
MMRVINIHHAKTHLSRLVEEAAKGDGFVIAKAGRPIAQVVPLTGPTAGPKKRIGFMAGEFSVPPDFDDIDIDEIADLFEGKE